MASGSDSEPPKSLRENTPARILNYWLDASEELPLVLLWTSGGKGWQLYLFRSRFHQFDPVGLSEIDKNNVATKHLQALA
tara:strand:+ start:31715 stop:31954 length:240 start_codon:yes stop_codon:yes gene_type:complete